MGLIEVVYKGLIIVINSTYGADALAISTSAHCMHCQKVHHSHFHSYSTPDTMYYMY